MEGDDDLEKVKLVGEEELLDMLKQENEYWADPTLYETQIEKILDHFGSKQSKSWSGQDTENLVRDVIECSLTLMEMAEMEQEEQAEQHTSEMKQELISKYLFGVAILRASTIENEERYAKQHQNIEPKRKELWLSEIGMVK